MESGTYIGLNPKGWGPLTLQQCQCRACVKIRTRNEACAEVEKEVYHRTSTQTSAS